MSDRLSWMYIGVKKASSASLTPLRPRPAARSEDVEKVREGAEEVVDCNTRQLFEETVRPVRRSYTGGAGEEEKRQRGGDGERGGERSSGRIGRHLQATRA